MVILFGEFLVIVGMVHEGAIFQEGLNSGSLFDVLNRIGIFVGLAIVNLPHILAYIIAALDGSYSNFLRSSLKELEVFNGINT